MAAKPITPELLKRSEVPITFDRSDHLDFVPNQSEVPITFNHSDHPNFVPKLGWDPLMVYPIIKDVKLN
jgi:hypothetical protein